LKYEAAINGILCWALLSAAGACAQGIVQPSDQGSTQNYAPLHPSPQPATLDLPPGPLTLPLVTLSSDSRTDDSLPDAPSSTPVSQVDVVLAAHNSFQQTHGSRKECTALRSMKMVTYNPNVPDAVPPPCAEILYPYQRFLDTKVVIPLSWQQKGYLALHQWSDPANFMTIAGVSAISTAANPDSAYGPGFKGWAKLTGVSLSQDATGEFFGTFVIPSLAHQDPRYFRMGKGSIPRRLGHAVSQTYVGNRDGGGRMPNYGVLITYPVASVISNLYVPGIEGDVRSTTKRVFIGYALEPTNNIVSEFVPDLASRVHIRIIFVHSILNNIAAAPAAP
jgi:hypothetical protein